jgi:hypothetical protein
VPNLLVRVIDRSCTDTNNLRSHMGTVRDPLFDFRMKENRLRLLLLSLRGLWLLSAILFFSWPAPASTLTVFGPKTYTREAGKPDVITDVFAANSSSTYRMTVSNQGPVSAVITLNGQPVFVESDFDPSVTQLTKTVILQTSNELKVDVRSKFGSGLIIQITGVTPATTLNLHAFQFDPSAASNKGRALGAGVRIQINGRDVGMTDIAGAFSTTVSPGIVNITGKIPSQAVGQTNLTIAEGQRLNVDLLLDFDKEAVDNALLTIDEAANQLLDVDFTALTLRFTKNSVQVPIATIDSIDLLNRSGDPVGRTEANFSVDAQGVIHGSNITALRSLFQAQPEIVTLRVMASDSNGLVYQNDVSFYLARFNVSGTLLAPPSFPALNAAGIEVEVTLLGTPLTLSTTSESGGAFSFPRLPAGLIGFESSTQQQGKFYYGQGQLLLKRDVSVYVVMRNQDDVKNGVAPITVTTAFSPLNPADLRDARPSRGERQGRSR